MRRIKKMTTLFQRLGGILLILMLSACATTANDPAESFRGESQQKIFTQGEKALHRGQYKEAIKRFEALEVQYPYAQTLQSAQQHIIYAHYMNEDYPSAQSAAERYIHAWPASVQVSYAYYMRALSYYHQNLGVFERVFPVDLARRDLEPMRHAWMDFAVVARQFPESEYAPVARQYMIYLRNMMALHQLQVAQFYFDRHAYIAAANRASEVIRYYEGAPAIKPALSLLARSYHALHAIGSEREVLRVIKEN